MIIAKTYAELIDLWTGYWDIVPLPTFSGMSPEILIWMWKKDDFRKDNFRVEMLYPGWNIELEPTEDRIRLLGLFATDCDGKMWRLARDE